jgi:hypothetical protein
MELGTGEHVVVGTGGALGIRRSIAEALSRYCMRGLLTNSLRKSGVRTSAGTVVS